MTSQMIPMVDLRGEVEELHPELSAAIDRVLRSGQFILGPEVVAFEQALRSRVGGNSVVGVASGSDALAIALEACGVGPGDEVITSAFSFVASASAILRVGATPVFVDIDPTSFNLDPEGLAAASSASTRAIVPVHLYGQPCDMTAIGDFARAHGLLIVEDAAQALGARWDDTPVCSFGDASALSFFPTKNLGAYGDAGACVFRDVAACETARMLRAHGARRKYENERLGLNSRLDAIQAAVLRVKLRRLDQWNEARRTAAVHYDELLATVAPLTRPAVDPRSRPVFHQYTVRVPRRDAVRDHMAEAGVASMVYYPIALPDLPLFGPREGAWPHARRAAAEVLSLPMWPGITGAQRRRVADSLRAAIAATA